MDPALSEGQGLRIAVEGCGHGTLDAIYASVEKACEVRGWDGVDLLIIGGDFQAVRNAADLTVMSCPLKFRAIGDFHKYYSGRTKAPYLTIFVGGNHEASSHMWELYYGGWVAPNIFYMGAAGVIRLGGVRIAGMSGIFKGFDFRKHHHERIPYNENDIHSIYHIRELDVRKLLQLRTQVDIGISHDWPRAIEKYGNFKALFNMKPDFEYESNAGTLGNPSAASVMDRLRPQYWFAAHLHCKFSATKTYEGNSENNATLPQPLAALSSTTTEKKGTPSPQVSVAIQNADEIDLDMDDEVPSTVPVAENGTSSITNEDEIDLDSGDEKEGAPIAPINKKVEVKPSEQTPSKTHSQIASSVPSDVRAQLPAAFSRPTHSSPPEIVNKAVRFLALDKCLPGRKFLQLLEVSRHSTSSHSATITPPGPRMKPKLEYDPEWLAITRVFAPDLVLGNRMAPSSRDLGEAHYRPLIKKEQNWVDENIVKKGKLEIPENFVITAPIFEEGMPEKISEHPVEYNNSQMQEFCELVGIKNRFFATEEERKERMAAGPDPVEVRRDNGRGRGRGRGGRGGRGRGGERGRGRG